MIGASEQTRPAERFGTMTERFDRRLGVAIGRQSAQRKMATHASHHDVAFPHLENSRHDGSPIG
jgi:hypothetical protein